VSPAPAGGSTEGGAEKPIVVPRPRPRRPRHARADNTVLSLWLVFGTIAAVVVVWVALKSNIERPKPPVEGASAQQQANADSLLAVVQRDSTNVDARNQLADVLYDTGNWPDAIVQYRATVRMDSSRVPAIVDMGVCYFNLSDGVEAERLFQLALTRDPHQVVALFNLGILHESRKEWKEALRYYHEAMQNNPPASMQQPLQDHMMQAMKQAGEQAPPLPQTR
jgi:tetratricopeptide (TPR) repeat protein